MCLQLLATLAPEKKEKSFDILHFQFKFSHPT